MMERDVNSNKGLMDGEAETDDDMCVILQYERKVEQEGTGRQQRTFHLEGKRLYQYSPMLQNLQE
jgi:hypothetical protein